MSQSPTTRSLGDLDVIVDSDAHVSEDLESFSSYIDDDHAEAKEVVLSADEPRDDIYTRGHAMPSGWIGSGGYGSTADAGSKLEEMRDFDIDYGVVTPTLNLALNTVENSRIAVALANGYNSWLVSEVLDGHDALKGGILAAPQKPDRAAEEIDRLAGEDDMVAIALPATGIVPPPGHWRYDPIYEAAEDHGLPIVMHGANSAMTHSFPTQRRFNETYFENHVICHPFTQMWNLTSMLVQGVPARYPDVEFVVQESGIGWLPYLKWRLDDHYLERSDEAPYLEKLPSKYLNDQFYVSTQPLGHTAENPEHLAWAVEMIGADSVMYASDLPHHDFDPPEELFGRINSYFDPETVRGIMGETAADLFDVAV